MAVAPLARSPVNSLLPGDVLAPGKIAAALVLGAAWLLRRFLQASPRPFPPQVAAFLAAWAGLTVVWIAHSVDARSSALYTLGALAGVAVFVTTWDAPRRVHHAALAVMIAGGAAIGALVVLQYVVVEHHVFTALEPLIVEPRTVAFEQFSSDARAVRAYRPSGTMAHPNAMGLFFAALIPFAFSLITVKGLSAPRRAAAVAGGLAMFAGLLATNSRAALLTAAVAMAVLCSRRGYRRVAAAAGALLILGAGYYLMPGNREAARRAIVEASRIRYGLSGRNDIWRKSAELARQNPLLGVGPGNFATQFVGRFGYFTPQDELEQQAQIWMIQTLGPKIVQNFNAHSVYLQTFAELGALGPLLFVAGVFLSALLSGKNAARAPAGTFRRATALAALSSALALLVYGVFDSQVTITQFSLNLTFAALLGIGLKA